MKLRSVAEQQVIKIRSEMESARTRITKLEEDVKHLGAKQKVLPIKPMFSDHSKVVENDISNDSLNQSFLMCLKRLQDVLKELKLTSALSRCSDLKDPSQEIQEILDSVYAAVREFAPKMNHLILESCRPLTKVAKISSDTIQGEKTDKQTVEHYSEKLVSSSFDQKLKDERYKYSEYLFEVSDKNRRFEYVSTASSEIQTSVMVKGCRTQLTRDTNLVKSASPKSPQVSDASQKKQNDVSFACPQNSSRNVTNNFCVNSLKSLQNNLEEILQELNGKINDASSDEMNSRSQLTINGNFSDLTNQESEPHYSMDFDSFRTSKNSISNISNDENRRPSSSTSKKRRHFSFQEHKGFSSSSSINLSSIVDLLGNFSVEDIGSSTLTPP